jgi:hypothetical protein
MGATLESDDVREVDVKTLEKRVSTHLERGLVSVSSSKGPKAKRKVRGKSHQGSITIQAPQGKVLYRSALGRAVRQAVEETVGTKGRVFVLNVSDPSVEQTLRNVIERVPEIVRTRRTELTESHIESLISLFLPEDPAAEARRAIELDNARERARFVGEVACLTSKQVAEIAGHKASNTSVTGSRWKQQGRIFSVPWRGGELYPAFQFRDGQPLPTVAKVLSALPSRMSPWQIAFWFTSSNSWLDGTTPAERLDDEAEVLQAAHREGEAIVG